MNRKLYQGLQDMGLFLSMCWGWRDGPLSRWPRVMTHRVEKENQLLKVIFRLLYTSTMLGACPHTYTDTGREGGREGDLLRVLNGSMSPRCPKTGQIHPRLFIPYCIINSILVQGPSPTWWTRLERMSTAAKDWSWLWLALTTLLN
jgi:hypothetical protein